MARTWKRGGGSRTTNGIDSMKAQLTFLGTGTSQGVPIIGCTCAVCRSRDERDKRFRSSALVRYGGMTILVDAGPDFRSQMLRAGVGHLDAILLTHNHKDHTGGLDDVRSLNYIDRKAVEIYCEAPVLDTLRREYAYAFERVKYPGAPEWNVHLIDEKPFTVRSNEGYVLEWVHDVGYRYVPVEGPVPESKSVEIIPIRGWHGTMPVLGFRFGNIAYITDMSRLEDDQLDKLKGLDHVTLNTVSYHPHHSHFSLDEALALAGRIGARHTWLTHLSHTFPVYAQFCDELATRCAQLGLGSTVLPAYDGLVIA